MTDNENSNLTAQVNIRVAPGEKEELESRAKSAGWTLSMWGRTLLLKAIWPATGERRDLLFHVLNSEIIRLSLVAAQSGQDITSRESQERIERQARASAEAILDRRVSLVQASKGAA